VRVFVFGANGMLGRYIHSYFNGKFEVIPLTRKEFDISQSFSSVSDYLFDNHNLSVDDIIINAAGIIKQRDFCNKQLITVNSLFPHYLADLDSNVIHITTDCVFSGLIGKYDENSLHDCLDDYGKSKSLGENESLTVIRTSIIGEEKTNKKSLLEWVRSQENNDVYGYLNHFWNGVTCLELSKFIFKIVQEQDYWKGVRHIFSPDTASKSELVSYISEIYSLGINIIPKEVELCDRSLATIYTPKITKTIFEQITEIKDFNLL
jgi:dTDP-4-dehydrorhamnose reductase